MNVRVPHIAQYQGSKRILAPQILQYISQPYKRLIEPFSGMAAISIAAAQKNKAESFLINDINTPLVEVLRTAITSPEHLHEEYTKVWEEQFSFTDGHLQHYYKVRDRFNQGEQTPANMLYLLARCVKGSVRYGKDGNFNQSPDKRRHGTKPSTIFNNITAVSHLLKGRASFSSLDYRQILIQARPGDLVYMDPPYQGVSNVRDNRYFSGVDYTDFVKAISDLDMRGIDYIISYDGVCGERKYGLDLPTSQLKCKRILLDAGLSTQATLLGKRQTTYEALYISNNISGIYNTPIQLSFLENSYEKIS